MLFLISSTAPEKPFVSLEPKGRAKEVLEGKPMNWICKASGSPRPSKEWLHNGTKMASTVCYKNKSDCEFEVRNPQYPQDSGNYTCRASNSEGTHEDFVDVTVLGRCIDYFARMNDI